MGSQRVRRNLAHAPLLNSPTFTTMNDGGAQVWIHNSFVLYDSTDREGTCLDGLLKAESGEGLKKEGSRTSKTKNSMSWDGKAYKMLICWSDWLCPIQLWTSHFVVGIFYTSYQVSPSSLKNKIKTVSTRGVQFPVPEGQQIVLGSCLGTFFFFSCLTWAMPLPIQGGLMTLSGLQY